MISKKARKKERDYRAQKKRQQKTDKFKGGQ